MLVKVTALLAEMAHNKGHTAKKGKGKKKHRVQLDEAQRARLNNIKALAKAEGKKYSERRKLVREFLKDVKEAQRVALGLPPGAAIPRQPRVHRPKIAFTPEEQKEFETIKKIPEGKVRRPAFKAFFKKIDPNGTRGQPPEVAAAVAEVNVLKQEQRDLQAQVDSAPTPAAMEEAAADLIKNQEDLAAVANAGADAADEQGDSATAAALGNVAHDAEEAANNMSDDLASGELHSRFSQPSFGAGLGRRGMLSRWG